MYRTVEMKMYLGNQIDLHPKEAIKHLLEQAPHNRLDIEALEVGVGLAAPHKHDRCTRGIHH